ncbi:MAG: secretin N-terminal domain-containing protein [Planctomycetota bacterium]
MRHHHAPPLGTPLGRLTVAALLALATAGAAGGEAPPPAPADTVNMEFRDTDLPVVLRAICQGAGLDFVLEPSVHGKVTAKLRNTAWSDALAIVLESHELEARREGKTLIIAPRRPDDKPSAARTPVTVTARLDGTLDLDAGGADVAEAIRQVAAAAGLNVVTAKEVTGSVTASLRGLPPAEVLEALADSVGAAVTVKGNRIVVGPRSDEPAPPAEPTQEPSTGPVIEIEQQPGGRLTLHARRASVRELLAQLAAAAEVNVVGASTLEATVSLDLRDVTADDALAALATVGDFQLRESGEVLVAEPAPPQTHTEAFRLRIGDAEEIGEVLKSSIAEAKTSIVPAHNLVVVTGTAREVETARTIVEQVEIAPLQVTIDTLMIETNLTGDENIGVQWSDFFGIDATCPTIPHSFPWKADGSNDYHPGYDPADSRGTPGQVPFADPDDFQFGFLSGSGLSMVLNFLQEQGSARTVAHPTITTLENQEAKINMVTKFPIAQYQVSTETGVLSISGFEYQEFGTILEVTPRVHDGHILMTVHPEVSRQAGTTTFDVAELPIVASQETTTQVRIKDGNTLVIAGLIREDSQSTDRRVPWLSRIPLLGSLFRNRRARLGQRRHLLIFITPHIVRDEDFVRDAERRRAAMEVQPLYEARDDEPAPTVLRDEE